MPGSIQLFLDGEPADPDLYPAATVEVEENMDLPGAAQLTLPVSLTEADELAHVSDARFGPLANLAVVVTPPEGGAGGSPIPGAGAAAGLLGGGGPPPQQCIFDGYVLSQKLHLEPGAANSTLVVWCQDATWLMNLEEKVKEWVDVTDAAVANAVFGDYGITPADDNTADDSPSHTETGHSLMQRGSDIQFLRALARRNGKVCRVACADRPGQRTGYFAAPRLDAEPAAVLSLADPEPSVAALDLSWDVTLPTAVVARQALFTDPAEDGVSADTDDGGLPPLADRNLAAFAGRPMTVLLTAPVDDAGELAMRARALLRESGWFVRCEGEADADRLGVVLRAGAVVRVDGAGPLHSGRYLVWSVRHTVTPATHTMRFVLVRNAVGPGAGAGGGGGGLLAAIAGAL